MSTITETITADMKTAMRERNKTALNTLRALKSAIGNAAIEKSGAGSELPQNEVIHIIRKQIGNRHTIDIEKRRIPAVKQGVLGKSRRNRQKRRENQQ